jgi:hypothetical protein
MYLTPKNAEPTDLIAENRADDGNTNREKKKPEEETKKPEEAQEPPPPAMSRRLNDWVQDLEKGGQPATRRRAALVLGRMGN